MTDITDKHEELKLEPGWFIEKDKVCYYFEDYPTTYCIPINKYKIGQKLIDSYKDPPKEYLKNTQEALDKISNEMLPITSEINRLQKKLYKLHKKAESLNTKHTNIIHNICKEHTHKWRRIINYDDAPSADGETLKCSRCGKVYKIRENEDDDNDSESLYYEADE
jgi:uncharacterized phage infection (PIP) family protein YhgE